MAACRSDFASCEKLVLTRADLVVYAFDLDLLARTLRERLSLRYVEGDLKLPRARLVGDLALFAGLSCPVYLCLEWHASELQVLVERLALRAQGPFVLVVPTTAALSSETRALLKAQDGLALALEALTDAPDGKPLSVNTERAKSLLAPMRERLVREALANEAVTRRGLAFFPTPAGSTWSEVAVRFRDGQTVSVSVREARGVLTYGQLGMASRRSSRPTLQWELLRSLAERRGILDWSDRGSSRKNQKRRERLAKDLKAFFRIDGEPIVPAGTGWRCVFSLEPES